MQWLIVSIALAIVIVFFLSIESFIAPVGYPTVFSGLPPWALWLSTRRTRNTSYDLRGDPYFPGYGYGRGRGYGFSPWNISPWI